VAIKGKGKTKSRSAARPPRPTPVVRQPPFFVRRWVQVVAALLAGMGLVTAIVWATNGLRIDDVAKARDARAASVRRVVQQWQTTVDGTLSKGLGTTGSGVGQIVILPSLSTSVATLAKGDEDKKAGETASTAAKLVGDGVSTLQNVDLPTMIRDQGVDLATTNYLLNSKARMVEGLQLYGRVAAQVQSASGADVDPAVADALIKEANALLPIATEVFNEGYSDYTEALARAGLLQPAAPGSGLSGAIPSAG